jgi:hypothetical protein
MTFTNKDFDELLQSETIISMDGKGRVLNNAGRGIFGNSLLVLFDVDQHIISINRIGRGES